MIARSWFAALPLALALALAVPLGAPAQSPSPDAQRDEMRSQLGTLLETAGPRNGITDFHRSTANPYHYVGHLTKGLTTCESLEVIVGVTTSNTIYVEVYPHYRGGYINLRKAKDPRGLMDRLLTFNSENFFFWGADNERDIFSGYTVTLESGFPKEALDVIVDSIKNQDKFVGKMKAYI